MEDSINVKKKQNRTRLCKVLSKKKKPWTKVKQSWHKTRQNKGPEQPVSPEAGPHQTALRLWSLWGPQICGDLDKHKNEKKEPYESTQNVKAINRELEKLKQSLSTKNQIKEEKCSSFFSKVLPHFVNTNVYK